MIAQHVAVRGHEAVLPTVRMLRYWWAKLNAAVFDGILHPCQLTLGQADTPGTLYGTCAGLADGRVHIQLYDEHQWTRSCVLGTLAHEMVHQYQYQHGLDMTHGDTFRVWAEAIKDETGLTV